MTEDEAREKWCHKTPRIVAENGALAPKCCCITDDCMAWRWERNIRPPDGLYGGALVDPPVDGYCGLASRAK